MTYPVSCKSSYLIPTYPWICKSRHLIPTIPAYPNLRNLYRDIPRYPDLPRGSFFQRRLGIRNLYRSSRFLCIARELEVQIVKADRAVTVNPGPARPSLRAGSCRARSLPVSPGLSATPGPGGGCGARMDACPWHQGPSGRRWQQLGRPVGPDRLDVSRQGASGGRRGGRC